MRYSTAVVLSTIAVGQAAAGHNRHASFHARREAAKRDVDWNNVAYDLKNVDWSAINWSSVFASTPAAKPTPTPEQKQPAPVVASPTPTPEAKKVEAAPTPAAPSSKAAESPKAAAPSAKTESVQTSAKDVVTSLLAGVDSICSAINAKVGINSQTNNGGLWIGGDSDFGMDVTNNGPDAVYFCWVKSGFTGMLLNVNAPAISVGLKSGQSVKISAAPGTSGACAPATSSTKPSDWGGIANTWAEFTFSDSSKSVMGAFNVSKNPNMNGCSISMQGSQCTSNMNQCVFQCKDTSASSCTTGYDLINCQAAQGGGGGFDANMGGIGGGCMMASNAERLTIAFS